MQGGREEIVGREGILGKGGWETIVPGFQEEDKAVVGGDLAISLSKVSRT